MERGRRSHSVLIQMCGATILSGAEGWTSLAPDILVDVFPTHSVTAATVVPAKTSKMSTETRARWIGMICLDTEVGTIICANESAKIANLSIAYCSYFHMSMTSAPVQRPAIPFLDVKGVTNHCLHQECITHVVLASPISSMAINRLSRRGAAETKSTRASGCLLGRRQSAVPMWHGKQLRQRSPINTRDQFRQKTGNPTLLHTPHTLFRVAPNNSDIVIPYGYAVCNHSWMVRNYSCDNCCACRYRAGNGNICGRGSSPGGRALLFVVLAPFMPNFTSCVLCEMCRIALA